MYAMVFMLQTVEMGGVEFPNQESRQKLELQLSVATG
jgi:hypothetical protein